MGKKGKFVAYFRVSTVRQGRSGLGLEAQEKAVRDYLGGNGWTIIKAYTEVESGRKGDRPELLKALAKCRLHKAVLIIARLDRLSRDAAFLLGLQKAGVRFVAADMPHADETVVGFMAVMAEAESRMNGERTRAALAAAVARDPDLKLGRPENFTNEGRLLGSRRGREANTAKAVRMARDVMPDIDEVRAAGTTSLLGIAGALNRRGVPSPRGGVWYASSVGNALRLADDNA